MNRILLSIILVIVFTACETNHEHDGLYVADKQITGITRAWILEGDELTIYAAGVIEVKKIDQYKDKIVTSDDITYSFNEKGNLSVSSTNGSAVSLTMVKVSKRTKYNLGELENIIDEANPPNFKR